MLAKPYIKIKIAFLRSSLSNDIYYPTSGIASIQGTCGASYNFNPLDIVHIDTREIHIIECLSGQTFSVNEEE